MEEDNLDMFPSDEECYSDSEEVFLTPQSSISPEFMSEESDYEEADDGAKTMQDNAPMVIFIHG